ncbi:MAG: extracellular solute-binding protein [Chloroflexi bacterium]|nr:extracellular solute-binding protein [Chloroflexota bacterium]
MKNKSALVLVLLGLVALLFCLAPLSAQDEVTLTFWFEGDAPATVELFQQVADEFAAERPGVSVEITSYGFDDFLRVMPLALDGGEGPDVAYVPWGLQALGRYALAGHAVELTDLAEENGWLDRYEMSDIRLTNGLTPDQIYGIPFENVTIGVFYNKEIFAELGLAIPGTLADFEAAMQAVLDTGMTPISVGGRDSWPLAHVWLQLVHTAMPIEVITGIEENDPAYRLDTPEFLAATEKTLEWAQAGYLDPNMLSTGFVDANNLFINGDVAMNIGGTWVMNDFAMLPEFEVGFFPTPQLNPDLPWHAGGKNPYNNLMINAATEHMDLAIEFVGYMLGEEAQTKFWNAGNITAYRFDEMPPPSTPLLADVAAANSYTGFGYNIGVTCSALNLATWRTLQELVGGDITPDELIVTNQQVYEEDCLSGE